MQWAAGSRNQNNTSAGNTVRDMVGHMGAARMLALAIVCILSLPGISRAQQVKLKAALQVPISELFIGQSLAQFKKEVEARTANAISADGAVLLCGPGEQPYRPPIDCR